MVMDAGWLKDHIRDIADFPKAGVTFKDITPLLGNEEAFRFAVDAFIGEYEGTSVDRVLGIEARGFILAAPVAYRLGAGFVPVRRKGKLPCATHEVSYTLEYGEATLQIHRDALHDGQRVLVVDDVLATGGTVQATAELVAGCGATLSAVAVLLELAFLDGRSRLGAMSFDALRIV